MDDYYRVLGVPRGATPEQIKKAYRQLARQHHPDVNRTPGAAARMKAVNEAYSVLSDPEQRAEYDAGGRRQDTPRDHDAGPFPWGSDPADDSGFARFFSDLMGRAHSASVPAAHATIELDLEEAWRGCRRYVSIDLYAIDPLRHPDRRRRRSMEVTIPAGVKPGQLIRLAGGSGNAEDDLYLEVDIRPHPRYALRGTDLLAELPVAPWEAALGAVVPFTLPDGGVLKVRVPAHAEAGSTLRVRGKGLPARPAGDLELTVRVVLPSAHDPRARRLYEQMRDTLGDFDARAQDAADRD